MVKLSQRAIFSLFDLTTVDGNWADWEDWGTCTVTCGGGKQIRRRSCTNPPAEFGGQPCPGVDEESRSCGEELCPGE